MAEELAASGYKYQCKAVEKSGRRITLSCERPVHVQSYCYDRVNRQHVMALTVQYFDPADHNKEKAHIEYLFLEHDFRMVKALRENVPGTTPRLLIAPDGGIWVRIMSLDSDYTRDVVLPLQSRGRIGREKRLTIGAYSQELLAGDCFVGLSSAAGRHSGRPDELVRWQFDKGGLFKKRTSVPIRFSSLGVLLADSDGLLVFNLLTGNEGARARLTRIDDRGRELEQWLSRPIQDIRMLVPACGYQDARMYRHCAWSLPQGSGARGEKREFIGVSGQGCIVYLGFSREGELLDRIPILQLPKEAGTVELDLVHRAPSGWIGLSYRTEHFDTGFIRWDGERTALEITAGCGEPDKGWTRVRGREELELAYQCMTYILQDGEECALLLSPFRPHYPQKKNGLVILRQ